MATYSNILAGGHRSLADYSPWGHTVGEDVTTTLLLVEMRITTTHATPPTASEGPVSLWQLNCYLKWPWKYLNSRNTTNPIPHIPFKTKSLKFSRCYNFYCWPEILFKRLISCIQRKSWYQQSHLHEPEYSDWKMLIWHHPHPRKLNAQTRVHFTTFLPLPFDLTGHSDITKENHLHWSKVILYLLLTASLPQTQTWDILVHWLTWTLLYQQPLKWTLTCNDKYT